MGNNGKENGNYYDGLLGFRDYWGYRDLWGRMEKEIETTIMGYWGLGIIGVMGIYGEEWKRKWKLL